MDIVIPLGTGSLHRNIELKYALRGIEQHVPHPGKVFIVGEKPEGLTNFTHIRCHDMHGASRKESNIYRKITEAIFDDRVSDDFQFWNDDHFLLRQWTGAYYFHQTVEIRLAQKKMNDSYRTSVANTLHVAPGKWWDIHCPIIYNKTKFRETVGRLPWVKPWGFCIKTCYCNLNGIDGIEHTDMKLGKSYPVEQIREMLKPRMFFSTGSQLHKGTLQILEELYPNKSIYET